MEITFDPAKNARNVELRGLSFEEAAGLDWDEARVREDDRKPYGERRFVALAPLRGRLHVVCFTETPLGIRVISFRKANARKVRDHEHQKAVD